ncbi:MAG: tRNA dihydrouridine synthase DusB [Haliea sp.]|jgi:tRNA-dihydrouridine synthase B|nr:tRNA dihydrouridine synthase DusB [Haliea sp.]
MLQIGPYILPNRVALAPMAGVSDLPFRKLCSEFGAGLVVSEMISCNPRLRESTKTLWRSQHDDEIAPRSVQIAGSDPQEMAEAARYNVARGAQIIDINMGCPAKKVCRRAAGSALLADEALVQSILNAVVAAVDVPVTLKIRTGSAPANRNGTTIARIAEDAGVAALAVHGRTRACAFNGQAEYDTIAAIVASVGIPVFANGDIDSPEKAAAVIAHTGAAGVMIGRAAQGRPWLCGQIATHLDTGVTPASPDFHQQRDVLLRHTTQLHQFYGDFMGVRIARKHVSWYLGARADALEQRRLFNRLAHPQEQLHFIHQLSEIEFDKELAA